MPQQFGNFIASELYCPKCKRAQAVRERLLLVLPSGELHEYLCSDARRTSARLDCRRRLRTDIAQSAARTAALRLPERSRLAAAEIPRRRADPMGDSERRTGNRRDPHENG